MLESPHSLPDAARKEAILITGGSGLLALNWAAAMRNRFHPVLGLHRRELTLDGCSARMVDLESVAQLVRLCEALDIRMVVHTAGMTDVGACERDPVLAEHVNVVLAENVAKACALLCLPLVHISTDHLFSGRQSCLDENATIAPVNAYACTKALAEQRVLAAHPAALVMRTNFYGWGPRYRPSFSDMILGALRGGNTVTLFEDVLYTPVLIETACRTAHDLVERRASGIFNVVGDECLSKYAFGLRLAAQFKLDPAVLKPGLLAEQQSSVRRPLDMSLSNRKTCLMLGRQLGDIGAQLALLEQQEHNGHAREMNRL